MADRKDPLPVTRQCALLDLPRSTFYHVPGPVSEEELELMALIDRCHLKHPFYGSRRTTCVKIHVHFSTLLRL